MSMVHVGISRRNALVMGLASSLAGMSYGASDTLPVPGSLPDALNTALKRGSPLVVMVSLEGCPFCKIARENYLLPIQGQSGLFIVQMDIRSHQMVLGFDGVRQTQDQLIKSWRIKVAPTVLFLGQGGKEVAERLVGGYIPDFYGSYLDDRLRVARAAVVAEGAI